MSLRDSSWEHFLSASTCGDTHGVFLIKALKRRFKALPANVSLTAKDLIGVFTEPDRPTQREIEDTEKLQILTCVLGFLVESLYLKRITDSGYEVIDYRYEPNINP